MNGPSYTYVDGSKHGASLGHVVVVDFKDSMTLEIICKKLSPYVTYSIGDDDRRGRGKRKRRRKRFKREDCV